MSNTCHGPAKQKETTCTKWYEGRLTVIENVPTWMCTQYSETTYDPDVVERIQEIVWSNQPPVRTVETAVYDLSRSLS